MSIWHATESFAGDYYELGPLEEELRIPLDFVPFHASYSLYPTY